MAVFRFIAAICFGTRIEWCMWKTYEPGVVMTSFSLPLPSPPLRGLRVSFRDTKL
jgi:hypothetical protein